MGMDNHTMLLKSVCLGSVIECPDLCPAYDQPALAAWMPISQTALFMISPREDPMNSATTLRQQDTWPARYDTDMPTATITQERPHLAEDVMGLEQRYLL